MREPRRPLRGGALLLLLLGPASGAKKNPQIYSIHPTGGPVRGGTQLEVRGKDLDDQTMECNFGNSESYLELSRTPCKFDPTASPARQGDMCLCVVPALHQLIGGISFVPTAPGCFSQTSRKRPIEQTTRTASDQTKEKFMGRPWTAYERLSTGHGPLMEGPRTAP